MSQTPMQTPDSRQKGRLPIIVDISIDDRGKQFYQIHESSRRVRTEMPRARRVVDGEVDRTPTRSELGVLSPGVQEWAQRLGAIASAGATDTAGSSSRGAETPTAKLASTVPLEGVFPDFSELQDLLAFPKSPSGLAHQVQQQLAQMNTQELQHEMLLSSAAGQFDDENAVGSDIWSADVEEAFEEILAIIPKNGSNKIKVSGRLCGRNELISDYIFSKTGKLRSRKQVSSHIQVIKNIGQKTDIIQLILRGPLFLSKEEEHSNYLKFEEIFSKINIDKSLGRHSLSLKRADTHSLSLLAGNMAKRLKQEREVLPDVRNANAGTHSNPHSRSTLPSGPAVNVENFFMLINSSDFGSPIVLTFQKTNPVKSLTLRQDAKISNRFPGLLEFKDTNIPIIHNMVNIYIPPGVAAENLDGLQSNYLLKTESGSQNSAKESPLYNQNFGNMNEQTMLEESQSLGGASTVSSGLQPESSISIFTCIYSFGHEIFKFNEENVLLNESRPFMPNFWKAFISKLLKSDELQRASLAFKGISIKQIIYDPSPDDPSRVRKQNIRSVIIWEFACVDSLKVAYTTTTNISLPRDINVPAENAGRSRGSTGSRDSVGSKSSIDSWVSSPDTVPKPLAVSKLVNIPNAVVLAQSNYSEVPQIPIASQSYDDELLAIDASASNSGSGEIQLVKLENAINVPMFDSSAAMQQRHSAPGDYEFSNDQQMNYSQHPFPFQKPVIVAPQSTPPINQSLDYIASQSQAIPGQSKNQISIQKKFESLQIQRQLLSNLPDFSINPQAALPKASLLDPLLTSPIFVDADMVSLDLDNLNCNYKS